MITRNFAEFNNQIYYTHRHGFQSQKFVNATIDKCHCDRENGQNALTRELSEENTTYFCFRLKAMPQTSGKPLACAGLHDSTDPPTGGK